MQLRYFNIEEIEHQRTEKENALSDLIGKLSVINDALKSVGSSIDTIDEEKVTSILEKISSLSAQDTSSEITNDEFNEEMKDMLPKVAAETAETFAKIKSLLEEKLNHIDINKQDPYCQVSMLHSAAGIGSFKLVELFFEHGANPNLKNCFGQTPGMRARDYANRPDIADYLDNLQLSYNRSRTGMFRHTYRKEFQIETDYQPNQEPSKSQSGSLRK